MTNCSSLSLSLSAPPHPPPHTHTLIPSIQHEHWPFTDEALKSSSLNALSAFNDKMVTCVSVSAAHWQWGGSVKLWNRCIPIIKQRQILWDAAVRRAWDKEKGFTRPQSPTITHSYQRLKKILTATLLKKKDSKGCFHSNAIEEPFLKEPAF